MNMSGHLAHFTYVRYLYILSNKCTNNVAEYGIVTYFVRFLTTTVQDMLPVMTPQNAKLNALWSTARYSLYKNLLEIFSYYFLLTYKYNIQLLSIITPHNFS